MSHSVHGEEEAPIGGDFYPVQGLGEQASRIVPNPYRVRSQFIPTHSAGS